MRKAITRRHTLVAVAISAVLIFSGNAALAAYPDKNVRLLAGFAPGAGADTTARLIAQKLSEKWGKSVVVDNRPGAGGTIAADIVAAAAPDGYTLDFITGNHTVTPNQRTLNYDPIKSFSPVIFIGSHPDVLVINPSVQANNLEEFIALAKKNPGKLNYGSNGSDGPFLDMELFKKAAGIDIQNVNYASAAPIIVALVGGEIQAAFTGVDAVAQLISNGTLKALAVTSSTRAPQLPNVPTLAEAADLPGFNEGTWYGILAPANTPPAIVEKINRDVSDILRSPEINDSLVKQGFTLNPGSPAEFGIMMEKEIKKWADLFASMKK